jgi:hypothetical protein
MRPDGFRGRRKNMNQHMNFTGEKASRDRAIRSISDLIWGEFKCLIEKSFDYSKLRLKIYMPELFDTCSSAILKEFEKIAFLMTKRRVTVQCLGFSKKKRIAKLSFSIN